MSKIKRLVTNVRFWILLVLVVLSIIAINPQFNITGVAIRSVEKNSSAAIAGMQGPLAASSPTSRERIVEVTGITITSVTQFYNLTSGYPPNQTMRVITDKAGYTLTTKPIHTFDPETNTTEITGTQDIGIKVYDPPKNNLRLGLDLSGGTRVILQPTEQITADDLDLTINNIRERLNVYGLSDIIVRDAKDLSGNDFIIVEIAGAEKDQVQALLANQGKFEATVKNTTIFRGGNDITYVCRTPDCSGLGKQGCGSDGAGGHVCQFAFTITLSPSAAQRQADATKNLQLAGDGQYLEAPLILYLDNEKVDELQIDSSLRGRAVTNIQITGSGSGPTQDAAAEDAINNMKKLQTILFTGSLPVKLNIVKADGISPVLGQEFLKNAMFLALFSVVAVAIVIVARYRKPIVSIPIMVTMLSEVVIILGFAAAVGWNLDLASIAAIIIAIGSGVDDQIVLIDETLSSGKTAGRSWKERLAAAFFIIFASYFTLASAMLPLFFAGAGLLRGFAITTLVGVTAGVLVTRPAFAKFIEILLKKEGDE